MKMQHSSISDKTNNLLDKMASQKMKSVRRLTYIGLELLSLVAIILLAFIPFCVSSNGDLVFTAWSAIELAKSDIPSFRFFFIISFALLLAIALFLLLVVVFIFKTLINFSNEEKAAKQVKTTVIFSSVVIALYTAFTFMFSPLNVMFGGKSASDVSYTPLIMIAIIDVLYALTVESLNAYRANREFESMSSIKKHEAMRKKERRTLYLQHLEAIIFAVAIFSVATLALMSKIIKVNFTSTIVNIPEYVISGKALLVNASNLATQGERVIAYCVFFLFFMSAAFVLLALISFISRSSMFSKMATSSLIASSVACVLVGMFGQYYKIVQTLNKEVTLQLLKDYSIAAEDLLTYEIKSESLIYTYILLGVLILLFIRHPLTKAKATEERLMRLGGAYNMLTADIQIADATITEPVTDPISQFSSDSNSAVPFAQGAPTDFDPCPAFTELDGKMEIYQNELRTKQEHLYTNPTLPSLVNYIVQYARDSKHHLSYTDENIATFLAGLGATKLSILQGMSGTGKTSLPKIVSESLMSICDIVEVESSWRDKNELLGYYNEFSKIYTPKKFTQALYKACLNSDTLTFIVLDEMNLSRIEYYFSDFLSLMENEPDKREIKLLNLSLERTEHGDKKKYEALVDGHTIKIPQNIWFIGTANRDESTYDISDKVYDRAHTMNFDRRAQKPLFYGEPISAKYLPASEIIRLFDEAKEKIKINIDDYPVVKKVEELLEPYNISFGNRIAMQIESFVSIYASCFALNDQVIHDAFDIILLSKVVKKLELKSVVDKEELANGFDQIGLKRCANFVMGLKED
jgi:predicted AAA+ superfamily ATPase/uncharacterized membrane protein (DUF485 family)